MTSGAKAIVVYQGKVLLTLRDNKPTIPYPNIWDLPGGATEEGESMQDTVLRELEEEFNLHPSSIFDLGIENFDGRQAGRFIAFLTPQEFAEIKFGDEGQKYDFFTLDEVSEKEMVPSVGNFIKRNKDLLREIIEEGREVDPKKFSLL